jgi:hypothetical protein
MKIHKEKLSRLILGFLGMFVGSLPTANAGEAAKYIGEIYSYAETPGFAFSDKKSREIGREYLLGLIISNSYGHTIFLLTENARDKSKKGIVYDAIDIPKAQSLIGSLEQECKAKKYPNETIFVTGKWVNRKTPKGGFAGGYAQPITKAWRVNFEKKKLEVIPTAGIKCEDNRTDADVD